MGFLLVVCGRFVNHSGKTLYTLTQHSPAVKLAVRDTKLPASLTPP